MISELPFQKQDWPEVQGLIKDPPCSPSAANNRSTVQPKRSVSLGKRREKPSRNGETRKGGESKQQVLLVGAAPEVRSYLQPRESITHAEGQEERDGRKEGGRRARRERERKDDGAYAANENDAAYTSDVF